MDDLGFDHLTRTIGDLATRRTAIAGGLAASLAAFGIDIEAKKKKKCKKPRVKCGKKCCVAGSVCAGKACLPDCATAIAKTDTLWTLQRDCATKATIALDDGVTLDGANHTIRLAGAASGYQGADPGFPQSVVRAGVLIQDGDGEVHDLTIDQAPSPVVAS